MPLRLLPSYLVEPWMNKEHTGKVNDTKPVTERNPGKMPYQPAEVLKVHPQACSSGIHDSDHGIHFAFHFIF